MNLTALAALAAGGYLMTKKTTGITPEIAAKAAATASAIDPTVPLTAPAAVPATVPVVSALNAPGAIAAKFPTFKPATTPQMKPMPTVPAKDGWEWRWTVPASKTGGKALRGHWEQIPVTQQAIDQKNADATQASFKFGQLNLFKSDAISVAPKYPGGPV